VIRRDYHDIDGNYFAAGVPIVAAEVVFFVAVAVLCGAGTLHLLTSLTCGSQPARKAA
jgi:hypothetical protein